MTDSTRSLQIPYDQVRQLRALARLCGNGMHAETIAAKWLAEKLSVYGGSLRELADAKDVRSERAEAAWHRKHPDFNPAV